MNPASSFLGGRSGARSAARPPALTLWVLVGAAFSISACIVDSDAPCGALREDEASGRCVCPPDHAFTPEGCVECGRNEIPGVMGCECEEGHARRTADAACEAIPLGSACDPAAPICAAPHQHCEPLSASDGYCTIAGCETKRDCPGDYECGAANVCLRPIHDCGDAGLTESAEGGCAQ